MKDCPAELILLLLVCWWLIWRPEAWFLTLLVPTFSLQRYISIRCGYQVMETDLCFSDPGLWAFQSFVLQNTQLGKLPIYSNKVGLFRICQEVLSWIWCNPESDVCVPPSSGFIFHHHLPSACCPNHRTIYFLNSPCTFTLLWFCNSYSIWNVPSIPLFAYWS